MITLTQISKYAKYLVAVILAFILSFLWTVRKSETDEVAGHAPPYPYASADIPPPSTPFIAIWNGIKYLLENDFMFGRPRSYFASYVEGKREYESDRVFPDLYKLQTRPQLKDGKLAMQIQEIEPEESFINGFELMKVTHPLNTTVLVDSEYRKFHILDNEITSQAFISPKSIIGSGNNDMRGLTGIANFLTEPQTHEVFKKNDHVAIEFSNLVPGGKYNFVITSSQRLWVIGHDESVKILGNVLTKSNELKMGAAVSVAALGAVGAVGGVAAGNHNYGSPATALTPEPVWSGPGSSGGTCSCGSGGGDGGVNTKCLQVSYKNESGQYSHVSTVEPRALSYDTEIVELPRGSVDSSGNLSIKIVSTEYHHVSFIGLLPASIDIESKVEKLELTSAIHQRLNTSVVEALMFKKGQYVHTIPGDIIDLEFSPSIATVAEGEVESYLIKAGGFYTALSDESKQLAGDWTANLSVEAKDRLANLGLSA